MGNESEVLEDIVRSLKLKLFGKDITIEEDKMVRMELSRAISSRLSEVVRSELTRELNLAALSPLKLLKALRTPASPIERGVVINEVKKRKPAKSRKKKQRVNAKR